MLVDVIANFLVLSDWSPLRPVNDRVPTLNTFVYVEPSRRSTSVRRVRVLTIGPSKSIVSWPEIVLSAKVSVKDPLVVAVAISVTKRYVPRRRPVLR